MATFPDPGRNELSFPCDSTFLEWWYTFTRLEEKRRAFHRVKPPESLAIMLSRPRRKDGEEIWLLVEIGLLMENVDAPDQLLGVSSTDVEAFIV